MDCLDEKIKTYNNCKKLIKESQEKRNELLLEQKIKDAFIFCSLSFFLGYFLNYFVMNLDMAFGMLIVLINGIAMLVGILKIDDIDEKYSECFDEEIKVKSPTGKKRTFVFRYLYISPIILPISILFSFIILTLNIIERTLIFFKKKPHGKLLNYKERDELEQKKNLIIEEILNSADELCQILESNNPEAQSIKRIVEEKLSKKFLLNEFIKNKQNILIRNE